MKDYGSQYPIENKRADGDFIEEIAMTIASLLITGVMAICFVLTLPACVDQLAGHSANVVSISRGTNQ
jgi:hypothetical protein